MVQCRCDDRKRGESIGGQGEEERKGQRQAKKHTHTNTHKLNQMRNSITASKQIYSPLLLKEQRPPFSSPITTLPVTSADSTAQRCLPVCGVGGVFVVVVFWLIIEGVFSGLP